jgi:hypothetical protein
MRLVTSVADDEEARLPDVLLGVVEAVAPVVLVEPAPAAPVVPVALVDC